MVNPPFVPVPQPALVAYLEGLLERARAGEVQFLVASAGVTPEGEPTGFDVRAFSAIGDRVGRWAPAARTAAYATMLEGLSGAAQNIDKAIEPLRPRIFE